MNRHFLKKRKKLISLNYVIICSSKRIKEKKKGTNFWGEKNPISRRNFRGGGVVARVKSCETRRFICRQRPAGVERKPGRR